MGPKDDGSPSLCGNSWDPQKGAWTYLGGTAGKGFSSGAIEYGRIALDSSGKLVAAYSLQTSGTYEAKIELQHWGGSAFQTLGDTSTIIPTNVNERFDLAVDSADGIWIATQDIATKSTLALRYGSAWATPPTKLTALGSTHHHALTLTPGGHPAMAFRHDKGPGGNSLGFRHYDGTGWLTFTPDKVAGSVGSNVDIRYLGSTPYALTSTNMDVVSVLKNENGAWNTVGQLQSSSGSKSALLYGDASGRPWVVFRNSSRPQIQYFESGAWTALDTTQLKGTMDTSSVFQTMDLEVIDGVPVLAFQTIKNGRGIRVYAHCKGNQAWEPLAGQTLAACATCHYPQLAVGAAGTIYLSYRDGDNGNKMSVKVFARALTHGQRCSPDGMALCPGAGSNNTSVPAPSVSSREVGVSSTRWSASARPSATKTTTPCGDAPRR